MKTSNITFSDKMDSIFRAASYGFFPAAFLLLKTASLQAKEAYPHKGEKQESLELWLAGNERFVQNQPQHPHRNHDRLVDMSKDQHPYAPVFSCSDSQVAPELVFGQGLGDLFFIRRAVNTPS